MTKIPIYSTNPEHLPVEKRRIASVFVLSADNKMLMGRKDPNGGGVYPDAWHIPGGGVNEGETLLDAAVRELFEESSLQVDPGLFEVAPGEPGHGEWEKRKSDGTRVWCEMEFNRFIVHLDKSAEELAGIVRPGDDIIEWAWFDQQQLHEVEQIPGGFETMVRLGFIK